MAASDYQMSTSLAELIDAYIEASIIYHTYWKLYRNSPAASGKKVIEVLKAFEEDIANFNHAARRYFYTKHAGMFQELIYSCGMHRKKMGID